MDQEAVDKFIDSLHGDVVIRGVTPQGALTLDGALAARDWFRDRLAEITSTGGRPTHPNWTLKRQISFDTETWEQLKSIAMSASKEGRKIGPGQVAALIIREAVMPQDSKPHD